MAGVVASVGTGSFARTIAAGCSSFDESDFCSGFVVSSLDSAVFGVLVFGVFLFSALDRFRSIAGPTTSLKIRYFTAEKGVKTLAVLA